MEVHNLLHHQRTQIGYLQSNEMVKTDGPLFQFISKLGTL